VENNATSSSLDRTVSLEIIPAVTQGSGHIADQDVDNNEDQGQVIGDIQKFIAVGRARRNPRKPGWLTTKPMLFQSLKGNPIYR